MGRRFIMMRQTFMKLNLSYRLLLIIIVPFLIPYLSLFPWAYRKAEIIIRTKAQSLEKGNLSQTRDDIENLCLNIAKTSDCLTSLDHCGALYRKSEQEGCTYLKCWQYVDEQIRNVNNVLLSSSANIGVLSKDRFLYSTLSCQKFRYQDFFREQVVFTTYFSSVHESYRNFENNRTFISYTRELPSFCSQSYYLVISIPASNFSKLPGIIARTMELADPADNAICGARSSQNSESFREGTSISLSGWGLEGTTSTDFLYRDTYQLHLFTSVVSLVLLMACLLVTFSAIYAQLRPLLKLKEQMELVMSGSLNAEVATTSSRDEISSPSRTFNSVVNKISHLIDEVQAAQKRESELRFGIFLAQINPHFLFNTLSSIKWMSVVSGTDRITTTITSPGRLLEISMDKVNDVFPLGEKLEDIRSYIQIQQARYSERSDVFYRIDDSLLDCHTLKLILQPLMENSILHNVEHRDYLSIDISGKLSEDLITLCVKDNGTGMTEEQMEQILKPKTHAEKGYVFSKLGVCSVEERIRLAYGPSYGLEYNSDGCSYTEVAITFPRHQRSDSLLQKEAKQ